MDRPKPSPAPKTPNDKAADKLMVQRTLEAIRRSEELLAQKPPAGELPVRPVASE
jgi:hypothetical protein